MLEFCAVEVAAFVSSEDAGFFDAAIGLQGRHAIGSEKQFALFGFHHGIVEVRVEREPTIMWNGPRSSGPDDSADVRAKFLGFAFAAANDREFHPDGRAD